MATEGSPIAEARLVIQLRPSRRRPSHEEWRRYATEVERGTRTPSPATTRMLTETAIAQHEYATVIRQA